MSRNRHFGKRNTTTKLPVILIVLLMTLVQCPWTVWGGDTFRVNHKILERFEFPSPKSKTGKEYLGLSGKDEFTLSQIRGSTLVLEIFSMYCPICQAEASTVNKLYRLIEKDVRLKGKVKVVGVGTGNTPFEVEVFRKKFDIPFPLFADEEFVMQKISPDKIRTPTFLTLKLERGKELVVQNVHIGRLKNLQKFLKGLQGGSK